MSIKGIKDPAWRMPPCRTQQMRRNQQRRLKRSSEWGGRQCESVWDPGSQGRKVCKVGVISWAQHSWQIKNEEDGEIAIGFDNSKVICDLDKHHFNGVGSMKSWLVCAWGNGRTRSRDSKYRKFFLCVHGLSLYCSMEEPQEQVSWSSLFILVSQRPAHYMC